MSYIFSGYCRFSLFILLSLVCSFEEEFYIAPCFLSLVSLCDFISQCVSTGLIFDSTSQRVSSALNDFFYMRAVYRVIIYLYFTEDTPCCGSYETWNLY